MKKAYIKPHNVTLKNERDSILLQHLDDLYYLNVVRHNSLTKSILKPEWDKAFESYKREVRRATKNLMYKPNQKTTILDIAEKYFMGFSALIEDHYGLRIEVEKTVEDTEISEESVPIFPPLSFQDGRTEFYDWDKVLELVPSENGKSGT